MLRSGDVLTQFFVVFFSLLLKMSVEQWHYLPPSSPSSFTGVWLILFLQFCTTAAAEIVGREDQPLCGRTTKRPRRLKKKKLLVFLKLKRFVSVEFRDFFENTKAQIFMRCHVSCKRTLFLLLSHLNFSADPYRTSDPVYRNREFIIPPSRLNTDCHWARICWWASC